MDYKYKESIYHIKVVIGNENKLIIDGKEEKSKNKIKLSHKKNNYDVSFYIKKH